MTTIITKVKVYDTTIKQSITKKVPLHLQSKTVEELQKHYNTDTQTLYWWATQFKLKT